ncbi:MAG: GGDEF and EAL domain-containing protein [Treponema sp.]|uniref:GGDEF and EAL domain-containing protein n=1 Tax=Treponema sp. TaxID=166 RepID=UPI0025E2BCC3|nr:GGDEF and EAL domain-containing protein [Treponema sp.]MBR0496855.1 GGDEF and EAL domain-containing protein [Treponema sp.]
MSYGLENLELRQLEGLFTILNQCTDSFLFVFDLSADTYFISPYAKNLFNFPEEKLENASTNLMKIVYHEDQASLRSEIDLLKSGRRMEHNLDYRWVNKNGKPIWIRCRGKILPNNDENKRVLIGEVSIVADEDKTDLLTGLATESQLRIDFGSVWTKKQSVSGFILKVDIDNLGSINEQYGVMTGDVILSKVGDCCRKVCSGTAKAYKLSSDEFICMNLTGKSALVAQRMYENLRREISEAEHGLGYDIIFTVSGGMVAFMNDSSQLDGLLRKVNYSIANAKRNGRNNLVTFNAVDYTQHLKTLDFQEKIRDSIRNDFAGFELFYQPVVDAKNLYLDADKTVLNVIGCEALIRWTCPGYGILNPDEFIPILERTGMIVSVGRWILRTAFMQCAEWNRLQKDFHVSVNLSYIQVKKSDIIRDVETAMLISEVNPHNVTLELTESGYIDNGDELQALTEAFANLGVNVDIDDFGTGYSNLRYLQYLKASTLKLDYTFVQKATAGNEGDRKIIKHITQMAHELGMQVCMEGIEEKSDIEKLIEYGPDKFQGFYFGRPCNNIDFREHHLRLDVNKDIYNKTK